MLEGTEKALESNIHSNILEGDSQHFWSQLIVQN